MDKMTKKQEKPKRKTCPEASECRKYFYTQYEIIKERPYNASFAKDIMLFHHLCGRFPMPWVKGMIDFYLKWDDQFVRDCGFTIGVFYSKINQMLELNIHKSEWTKKHERLSLKPIGDIMKDMGFKGKQ